MRGVYPAKRTVFAELKLARGVLFVFRRSVVTTLAGTACKSDDVSHVNTSDPEKITPLLPGAG
jgi:hypothetical protein